MAFSSAAEERAVRIIKAAVKEAGREMVRVVNRKLADGRKIDARWVQATMAELSRVSDAYSSRAVNESTADFVEQGKIAARDTAALNSDKLQAISSDMINAALVNTKILIKDVTDASIKVVSEIITNAIVTGKSGSAIAKEIEERVEIEQGEINQQRAEQIARAEMMSIYRQVQLWAGERLGYKFYEYVGPDDHRTEQICEKALGVISTKEEWQKANPNIFLYGLHYGCRHQLVPVTIVQPRAYQIRIGEEIITAYKDAA